MKIISITTSYITLGQFLKFANVSSSGGEVKEFIASNNILVNSSVEKRRGRKLIDGDVVTINKTSFLIKWSTN